MDKHLLVTMGADTASSLSLRYVHDFFSNREDVKLTLLYVAPRRYEEGNELTVEVELPEDSVMACSSHDGEARCDTCQATLDAGRQWLIDMGFPSSNVFTKVVANMRGTVRDIVHEAERGMYDAVVLGRRGLSWFGEMFHDSVTHQIMWESLGFPVWISRGPDRSRRGIMLCADGSGPSLRMADHVGFVLRGEPRHKAVIFHMRANGQSGDEVEAIVEQAREKILQNEVEPTRIEVVTAPAGDPVKTILTEAERGAYAAIAIGRRTGRPTGMSRFTGQISLKLLRGLDKAALWLCK
jgi:nucleotide-binding universal stress UspA family protein